MAQQEWIAPPKYSEQPLQNAITVFTDAGHRSQQAVVTWQENGEWKHKILPATLGDILKTLELSAVVWAFLEWMTTPLNVVTDSLYVAGLVARIEDAQIRDIQNEWLFDLLWMLQPAIRQMDQSGGAGSWW